MVLEIINKIISDAVQTDFFAGGVALGSLGLVAASLRSGYQIASRMFQRRALASLILDNRTDAYRSFNLWMENTGVLEHSRHLRMTDKQWAKGTKGYAPAPGRHWFFYSGHLCRLDRQISEKAKVGASYEQQPMETLTVTILFGKVETILGWVEQGRKLAQKRDRIGPALHLLKDGYWEAAGDIPARALDTVLVDDDRIEKLAADMRWFYNARDWYGDRGVPWRRGYLLYGPPGTGKSSLIRALASDLKLDIASLDLGRSGLSDEGLREAMMECPKRCIIAIEDIDAVFVQRKGNAGGRGVSFSGLLNAIDGVAAQEGRALVMTTNHKERLDPALIRPGRADLHVELGLINGQTAARLFDRFFPTEPGHSASFRANLGATKHSPAVVQGWLLTHSDDPATAATAAGLLAAPIGIAAE